MRKLVEGDDYLIVPAPSDNEQAWQVSLLKKYEKVDVVFGNVNIDQGVLKYNAQVTDWPEGFYPDEEFKDYIGDVLENVIAAAITDGSIVLKDNDTGEFLDNE